MVCISVGWKTFVDKIGEPLERKEKFWNWAEYFTGKVEISSYKHFSPFLTIFIVVFYRYVKMYQHVVNDEPANQYFAKCDTQMNQINSFIMITALFYELFLLTKQMKMISK